MQNNLESKKIVYGALFIALNIVLGLSVSTLNLPFYGDTIGTIAGAIFFGPVFGATVGFLSSFIKSVMFSGIQNLPFASINVLIGLIVGYAFMKYKLTLINSIIVGLILSIMAALIGTPIGIAIYGGLTGTMSDVIVLALKKSGQSLFTSSFIAKIGNNSIDKIGSCIIVYGIIKSLPSYYKNQIYYFVKNPKSE